jgi:predicted nucleic acid-binding protein
MNLIVDTNVFLAVSLNEPEKQDLINISSGYDAVSPEILLYEIGNALSAMVKRHRLTESEALSTLSITKNIPVKLIKCNIQESLKIAIKLNIYAYDAYFLQCALSTNSPLITLDKKMKMAAEELNIRVLELS